MGFEEPPQLPALDQKAAQTLIEEPDLAIAAPDPHGFGPDAARLGGFACRQKFVGTEHIEHGAQVRFDRSAAFHAAEYNAEGACVRVKIANCFSDRAAGLERQPVDRRARR